MQFNLNFLGGGEGEGGEGGGGGGGGGFIRVGFPSSRVNNLIKWIPRFY